MEQDTRKVKIMPRYPKWVTQPKIESETLEYGFSGSTLAEIASCLRRIADDLEAHEDQDDPAHVGGEEYCSEYCGDYCYQDHSTGENLIVQIDHAIELTKAEIAGNIKQYEAIKAQEKKRKEDLQKFKDKQLAKTVRANKAKVVKLLAQEENDGT